MFSIKGDVLHECTFFLFFIHLEQWCVSNKIPRNVAINLGRHLNLILETCKEFLTFLLRGICRKDSNSDQKTIMMSVHTGKSFRSLIKSNRNQIVFTISRLIWNQTNFRLVRNKFEKHKYNQNLIWLNKIQKIFVFE